jgi:hypothetical protein
MRALSASPWAVCSSGCSEGMAGWGFLAASTESAAPWAEATPEDSMWRKLLRVTENAVIVIQQSEDQKNEEKRVTK